MSRRVLIILVLVLLIILSVVLWREKKGEKENILSFEQCVQAGNFVIESNPRICTTARGNMFYEKQEKNTEDPKNKENLIRVSNPKPDQVISSPIILEGEARGNWFFEASFPGQLLDQNGNVLSIFIAEAQGEWMTEEFVPFKARLEFKKPITSSGFVVFKKDNPSDKRELDDEVRIPVVFKDWQKELVNLKVYFPNTAKDPNMEDCKSVYPVERYVSPTSATARASITELLKGPTEEEKINGYFSSINIGVLLKKISIANGTAYVEFDNKIEENVGGSCRVSSIRSQIVSTLKQFSSVKEVVISVDGRTEDVLQP